MAVVKEGRIQFWELLQKVAKKTGQEEEDVREVIKNFLETIKEEVERGNEVKIPKFGKFYKLRKKVIVKRWKVNRTIEKIGFRASFKFTEI